MLSRTNGGCYIKPLCSHAYFFSRNRRPFRGVNLPGFLGETRKRISTLNPPSLIVSSEEEITPLPNSESRGVGAAKVANKQPVKSMIIFTQNEDTIIIFSTQEPLEFDIIENEYTNQIIVHLPKTEWTAVESMDKNGGLIESYTVDQEADPKTTNITFNVQKGTNVIGRRAKFPDWNRFKARWK